MKGCDAKVIKQVQMCAADILSTVGPEDKYCMPGSRLSFSLRESCPKGVEKIHDYMASIVKEAYSTDPKVKISRPTKGWLKQLVAKDANITQIAIPGIDEPCYALTRNLGTSAKVEKKRRDEKAARVPRMPGAVDVVTKFGDFAMPVVHGEQYAQRRVRDLVVELLEEADGRDKNYMEGGNLCATIGTKNPDIVACARASCGTGKRAKGWLKSLLGNDPRIDIVVVPGVDEPCYRLSDAGRVWVHVEHGLDPVYRHSDAGRSGPPGLPPGPTSFSIGMTSPSTGVKSPSIGLAPDPSELQLPTNLSL